MIQLYELFILYDVDISRRGFLKGMGALAAHAAMSSQKKEKEKDKSSLMDKVRDAHSMLKNKLVNNKITQKLVPVLKHVPDIPNRTSAAEKAGKSADMTRRQFLKLGGSVAHGIVKDTVKDAINKVKPYATILSPSPGHIAKKVAKYKDNHLTKALGKLGI